MRRLFFLAPLILLGVACGTSGEGSDAAEPVPTVPFEESSLVINVSSQSLDRDSVPMRVEVDGRQVADQVFETGGGHTNVAFPLKVNEGSHRILVTADDGTRLDLPLELPAERRWLQLSYWSGLPDGMPSYIDHSLTDSTPGGG